ncbi:MAG: hypothetical protein E2577_08040, partial [Starkeya sp.]|nr:hypothetical protein [Starkeya sp.]
TEQWVVNDRIECALPVELQRRDYRDSQGRDESRFLAPLEASLKAGKTPAEVLLERYEGAWNRSVEPVFVEDAY